VASRKFREYGTLASWSSPGSTIREDNNDVDSDATHYRTLGELSRCRISFWLASPLGDWKGLTPIAMPQQKRPLAESDANASKAAAKRVSTGSTVSQDENATLKASEDGSDSINITHLRSIRKKRDIPFTDERESAMIQRLREVDQASLHRYDDLQKT
jgi:hypothetical protein